MEDLYQQSNDPKISSLIYMLNIWIALSVNKFSEASIHCKNKQHKCSQASPFK